MKRIDMYITDSQVESIAKIVKENEGKTKSSIIRDALDNYIEEYNKENN